VETALKNVSSIPHSRPLPLSGDQKVFDHSRYLTHESGLLKEILLTYLALENSGNHP